MQLNKHERILFFGDSITDVGRDRENPADLGKGFPYFVDAILQATYPDLGIQSINRGISNDQVQDLLNRFEADCIAERPDIVVLLIGINDVWEHLEDIDFADPKQTARFEQEYRTLLDQLTQQTKRVLILEPFLLHEPSDRAQWRIALDPKIQVVRRLAGEFDCEFVALDGYFTELALAHGAKQYTGDDGVHPTAAAHYLMAQKILAKLECGK